MSWCMARCNTLYLCSCIILVGVIVLSNRVGQSLSLQRISISSWKRPPSTWNRQKNSWFQKRIMLTKNVAFSESAPVTATIQLQLEQSLSIDSFITHFRKDSRAIEGVFLLENADGIAVIADFSVDVYRSVAQLQSDFQHHNLSSVRVQTFSPFKKELALEYLKQVVRMTKPLLNHSENCELTNVVKSEVEESTEDDLLHNNPLSENTAKVMPLEESSQNEREPNVWELSLVNVDLVLNEIRPYLQSDGGNIAVVSVDTNTRSIQLQLQGACGSCPSSTMTMKMGVERILRERFADLGSIVAVPASIGTDSEMSSQLSTANVEAALEKVLPAISQLGGHIQVTAVDSETGTVYVDYSGPVRVQRSISMILEEVPNVHKVIFQS